MKLGYKIALTVLGSAAVGFVVSKIYVYIELKKAKERYSQPDVEKQQLIDLVISSKNLNNDPSTQQLYSNLDVQQLKDELQNSNVNSSEYGDYSYDYGYDL
jgi:hypothetical protein